MSKASSPEAEARHTAESGTAYIYGGTVFELNTAGTEVVLYSFKGGVDGGDPTAGLLRDSSGNLYGTTFSGGSLSEGIVFEVDQSGVETPLYSFAPTTDGA